MKTYLPWLLLLIGAMAVYYFWPDPKPSNSRELELQYKIKQRDQAVLELQDDKAKLKAKIDSDSIQHTNVIRASQVQINIQSRLINDLRKRPAVIQVINDNPQIDTLIRTYENVILEYALRDSMNMQYIETLRVDLKKIESNFEERLKLMDESVADLKSISEDQRKQLRKIRRGNRVLKIVSVVGAVGGLLLGGQL